MNSVLSGPILRAVEALSPGLGQSPASRGLLLVDNPQPVLLSVLAYVFTVLLGLFIIKAFKLQPREKEPRALLLLVLAHNGILFSLSLFMAISIPLEARRLGYSLWGNGLQPSETRMAQLIHLFYLSKYVEFFDTMIMLVRSSTRQISFLHVYHHASIMPIWWLITFQAPGGDAYFSATLNSMVHVAMYGYYTLAALIGRNPRVRAKYLFWGRYLTQAQMLQFLLNVVQATYSLSTTNPYPRFFNKLLLVYMMSLLVLFGHFYVSKYSSKKGGQKED